MNFENLLQKVYELLTIWGVKVLAAVAILIIGRWVAGFIKKMIMKLMRKSRVDETLVSFTGNLSYVALMAFVVLASLGQLGIQTTSFIAVLGAAGLAIGLALQGSLSNFAAGFLMIIFRPFKVGDLIEGGGAFGVVEEIQIFTTTLKTADNKVIIVPNSKMTGDNIVNWSSKGTRRVDLTFGIGYGDDIDKARAIMAEIIAADPRILKDPVPTIDVSALGESSVDFAVRTWVKIADYWGVYCGLTEKIKKAFDAQGINIPYPQRDIHIYQHTA